MAAESDRAQQDYSPLSKQKHFSREISTTHEVALRQIFLRGLRFSLVSIITPVIHTHVSFMQHRRYMTDSVLKSTLLSILFTPVTKFEYLTVLI